MSDKALPNYQNACDNNTNGWNTELKPKLAIGGFCGATASDTVTWKLTGGDTLTISGKGKMADYGNVNDIPWVNYRDNITEIVIEEGVESIGDFAFQDCSGLTSVTFAENSQLKIIGARAFDGCTNLTSITIPTSVTSIGSYAFYECTGLTSVTFVENSQLESIGANAFDGCTNLTSITIPTSVTSIGSYAFKECIGLTSVTIPEKVTSIEGGVFYDCTGLTSVTISEGVTKLVIACFLGQQR